MMQQAWRIFVAGLSLWAGGAAAQEAMLAPSAAQDCLTPALARRGDFDYPFAEAKQGTGGRVKIEARFSAPGAPPALAVLESEGGEAFASAAKSFMATWRVPCLPAAGGDVRFIQEYLFTPDGRRVYWDEVQDEGAAARQRQLACLQHTSGRKAPDYPFAARAENVQGRVVARLRFDAADRAPAAQVQARASAAELESAIHAWVQGYRLPCFSGNEPIDAVVVFVYRLEGEAFGFEPLTLASLLGKVQGIRQQTLALDTTTMGCPFDLQFTYYQPFGKNGVGMLGSTHPARQPLLQYLAGVRLDLPAQALDSVFADTTTVSVPCLKIDLKPKEKS